MNQLSEELLFKLDEKIVYGEKLVEQLNNLQDIEGIFKLRRKILQEVDFLKRVGSGTYAHKYLVRYKLNSLKINYFIYVFSSYKDQGKLKKNSCLAQIYDI